MAVHFLHKRSFFAHCEPVFGASYLRCCCLAESLLFPGVYYFDSNWLIAVGFVVIRTSGWFALQIVLNAGSDMYLGM